MGRPKKTEYRGILAQPIDTGVILPALDSPNFEWMLKRHVDCLTDIRRSKMRALFDHFGLKLRADFDPDNLKDAAHVWAAIAMNLAVAHVPGFQEKFAGKWPRELIMQTLVLAERFKSEGKPNPDLEACLWAVRARNPKLARSGRKLEAIAQAKTLRNKVSAMRQVLKRALANAAE